MKKVLKTIDKKIKDFDQLGSEHTLTYNKRDAFATTPGGLISIFVGLISSLIIVRFIFQYFDTSDPSITSTVSRTPNFEFKDAYKQRYVPHFHFRKAITGEPIPHEELKKYVTVFGVFWGSSTNLEEAGGVEFYQIFFELEPCIVSDPYLNANYLNEKSELSTFNKDFALCLNPKTEKEREEIYFNSTLLLTPYRVMEVQVYPCMLPNPADCKTAAELQRTQIIVGETEYSLDYSNYKNPVSPIAIVQSVPFIDIGRNTQFQKRIREVVIEDDRWDFMNTKRRTSYFEIEKEWIETESRDPTMLHCPRTTENNAVDVWTCQRYFSINLMPTNSNKVIVRHYKKGLETLGEIGGIFELMLSVGAVMYCCFKDRLYRRFIHLQIMEKEVDEYQKLFPNLKKNEIQEITDNLLNKEQDAIRLTKLLRGYQLLEEFFMNNHHKVLMPALLLKTEIDKKKLHNENNPLSFLALGIKEAERHESFDAAFTKLKSSSRSGILKQFDDFIVKKYEQIEGSQKQPTPVSLNLGASLLKNSSSGTQELSSSSKRFQTAPIKKKVNVKTKKGNSKNVVVKEQSTKKQKVSNKKVEEKGLEPYII